MNYLVIYPGRFHPFHRGHRASYEYLAKKYGAPYLGHPVTIYAKLQVPNSNPPQWQSNPIAHATLIADTLSVKVPLEPDVRYVSVRVEVDPVVTPGFYNDYVLKGLSLSSSTHYADFGFRA